jgi:hypothetical protein
MIASLFGALGAWLKFRLPEDPDPEGPSGDQVDIPVEEAVSSPTTIINP